MKNDPSSTNGSNGQPPSFLSSLRARLLLLVLLAVLPCLVLVIYTTVNQRARALTNAHTEARQVARMASVTLNQHIEAARQLLLTLSQVTEVRRGDPAGCVILFSNLMRLHPIYANFGAVDTNGIAFASGLPFGEQVDLSDRAWFKRALATTNFAVGEYQVGRITKKPTLNVAYPIVSPNDGRVRSVIYTALDLAWLDRMPAEVNLPPDSTLTLVDRSGRILVRQPDPGGRWAGNFVQDFHILRLPRAGDTNRPVEARGLDDVLRIYSSTALTNDAGKTDALLFVGIPSKTAFAATNRLLVFNLASIGLVAGLTLALAWFGSEWFILRRVQRLVKAARSISAGHLGARAGMDHQGGELGQLEQAFDTMAASLEKRVTERHAAEAELKRLNEVLEQRVEQRTRELQRSNEDLEQFAYVASHDLREPLRMISSYVQLLSKRYQGRLDADADEFIGYAVAGTRRMDALINDLLAYSRVGKNPKPAEPVDANAVLDTVRTNLKLAIEESGGQITSDPLPNVQGDPIQLEQLFQNLVGNALKFHGPQPPRVHVSAQRSPQSPATEWQFSVKDNGIGIDPKNFERIFILFQRLHGRNEYPGTGIGLSVCKKIVGRHGGRIWLESQPGQGTTFHFTLPTAK